MTTIHIETHGAEISQAERQVLHDVSKAMIVIHQGRKGERETAPDIPDTDIQE